LTYPIYFSYGYWFMSSTGRQDWQLRCFPC